jgi:tetrapyrrole methylase family protein/MazG family protein
MTLTILGLGPGEIDDLTRRAWNALESAQAIYLRTAQHPCVPHLPNQANLHSFDSLYEAAVKFEDVYDGIVARVLEAVRSGDVVYAVPGDPFVGEATTPRLIAGANAAAIPVEVIHGISFIEPMLRHAGIDAIDNLQILDALVVGAMHHPQINPDAPAFISQVYSRQVASEVKLTLMNQYPDDFAVKLIHLAGSVEALVEELPLHAIDHSAQIGHLTSLYVPALGGMSSFERFQEIIAHLRAPEGCPWDRKQTHESLRPYLIEEAYEVLEAIDAGDAKALYEELGDLLLQIVLHTQIAIEDGEFYMTDVLRHVNEKMIRRHPHVWGSVDVDNADQVVTNWEALKQQEKAQNGDAPKRESLLDGIPKGLPALMQAYKYQAKAAKVGFDWEQQADVAAKIREELDEVLNAATPEDRFEEIGDLLFVLVNWARWLGIDDPESALRATNQKFYRRFRYIEEALKPAGKPMEGYALAELDALWNEAKARGL